MMSGRDRKGNYWVEVNKIKFLTVYGDEISELGFVERNKRYINEVIVPIALNGQGIRHARLYSTYHMKHIIEKITGEYLSNYQLKHQLAEAGVQLRDNGTINPSIKILLQDYKQLKELSLRNEK